MKSSIKVDFVSNASTKDTLQPIINVKVIDSDDVRDKLLQTFFDQLGEKSSWLSIYETTSSNSRNFDIYPITDQELLETISIIKDRIGENEDKLPSRFQIDEMVDFTTTELKEYAFAGVVDKPENKGKSPEEIEYIPEYKYGRITSIKFTKAKVWYDILDDYSGKIFEGIPSNDVKDLAPEFSSKPKN